MTFKSVTEIPKSAKNAISQGFLSITITSLLLCVLSQLTNGQTLTEIQNAKDSNGEFVYYWGLGVGRTAATAEEAALSMLSNSISVNIKSQFTLLETQMTDGSETKFTEKVENMIKTHSTATLKNTEIIRFGEAPEIHIVRYIKRSEVKKIFAERANKIDEFVDIAINAEEKLNISEALKYYYWSLLLLQSHPDGAIITKNIHGRELNLSIYLPRAINNIFDNLQFDITGKENEPNLVRYFFTIKYNNQLVTSCEYSTFDGRNWSPIIASKNGIGFAEVSDINAASNTRIRIMIEYEFGDEWKENRQIEQTLRLCEPIVFRRNTKDISLNNIAETVKNQQELLSSTSLREHKISESISKIDKTDEVKLLAILVEVENAIRSKNYQSVKSHFTNEGYKIFLRLVEYGNAVIIGKANYTFLKFEDAILVRALPMKFTFTNRRTILENVVFTFDKTDNKITSLSFSVSNALSNQILEQKSWDNYSKMAIINFIENYQTAFALERLDYLKNIFSDNALIIVGRVVTPAFTIENRYIPPKIEMVKQSKAQYMKNLERVFRNNEYVNLKFSDISIMKQPRPDATEIYGISMQQNYFSATYGDSGYLFLIVDLNNHNEPIIHVRTWQPERDEEIGIYGFKDF